MSVWRVALMARVLMVIGGYRLFSAVCVVMLFADTLALVLVRTLPFPLIDIMGGVRLSERDALMKDVAGHVAGLGCCSMIVWLGGVIAAHRLGRPMWKATTPNRGVGWLPLLALASLLVWPFVLPVTQPPQARRRVVENLFAQGRVAEALAEMSLHDPSDYPPGWDPPPRFVDLTHRNIDFPALIEAIADEEPADWVRESYLRRLPHIFGGHHYPEDAEVQRVADALKRIPGGTDTLDHIGPEHAAWFGERLRKAMRGELKQEMPK
ncbi:MAG: hypothetical protein U0797_04775 [Gemmataceae bacterium]